MKEKKIWAVIPSAGSGSRMGKAVHKQFIELRNKPILVWTLEVFQKMDEVEGVVLVCSEEDRAQCEGLIEAYHLDKVRSVVRGGATRQASVRNGLRAVPEDCDIVLIHDGARPFVLPKEILETVGAAGEFGGALLAVPVKDTIKIASADGTVEDTPIRSTLWAAQTPQTFVWSEILSAHEKALAMGDETCTDDSQIMEKYGNRKVKIVKGSYTNIKLTTPEDLNLAEEILNEREIV